MRRLFKTLLKLIGLGPKADFVELIMQGAVILDVRTPLEFRNGHIQDSMNIPLDVLSLNLSKLKKNKPVIACCASGVRSASAVKLLKSNGFSEVFNAGSWYSLQRKIR